MARVRRRARVGAGCEPARARIADPVPRDAPGAREIGFAMPERYNASRILFDNLQPRAATRPRCLAASAAHATRARASSPAASATGSRAWASRAAAACCCCWTTRRSTSRRSSARCAPASCRCWSTRCRRRSWSRTSCSDSGAEAAIVDARFAQLLAHEDVRASRLRHVVHVGGASATLPPRADSVHAWDAWIAGASRRRSSRADTHRDEMAFWMYSSGSTGRPKGVVHLHHDAAVHVREPMDAACSASARTTSCSRRRRSSSRTASATRSRSRSRSARRRCCMPGRPGPRGGVRRDRAAPADPAVRTADAVQRADRASRARKRAIFRACACASPRPRRCRRSCSAEWQRRYGLADRRRAGLDRGAAHLSVEPARRGRSPARAGRACRATRSSLTDPEAAPVAAWRVRHPVGARRLAGAVATGTGPTRRAETMREGWIYTGDRFREDADGFYFFEGRADDLVKVSGQWVHPLEVERCLAEHPAVRECAVLARRGREPADDARGVRRAAPGQRAGDGDDARRCRTSSRRACCPTSIRARSSISTSCRRPAPTRSIARRF